MKGGPPLADRNSTILVDSNFRRVITRLLSILSLRVCLRHSLRQAEYFFKNEGFAELSPFEAINLRVCFGFTSNYSARLPWTRNDSLYSIKMFSSRKNSKT